MEIKLAHTAKLLISMVRGFVVIMCVRVSCFFRIFLRRTFLYFQFPFLVDFSLSMEISIL
jgi:hypothetical protein